MIATKPNPIALIVLAAAGPGLFALSASAQAQTPIWKQLVEQQLLNEQFCKVEYYVAEEVRGEGADQEIKAKVHCTDGRDFEIERKGETMKFRFEQCGKVYC
ncbi:MAG: hypothetical protein R3287_05510 [Anderseniella sp.]|nr:hypothetical protein [Anderseniella sp.]